MAETITTYIIEQEKEPSIIGVTVNFDYAKQIWQKNVRESVKNDIFNSVKPSIQCITTNSKGNVVNQEECGILITYDDESDNPIHLSIYGGLNITDNTFLDEIYTLVKINYDNLLQKLISGY